MTQGQVETAERKAFNVFDKWNDVSGFVAPDTGYYYEIQAVIKDAVHIGIQMAINGKIEYTNEGEVKKWHSITIFRQILNLIAMRFRTLK